MATVIRGDDNWDTALKAGSQAFAARYGSNGWLTLGTATILGFDDDSTGDSFDNGSNYSTSTYKYTAPTTGVYLFWFAIYTANSDTDNAFGFLKNSSELNLTQSPGNALAYAQNADDKMLSFTCVIPLTSGDTMAVRASEASDYYTGVSTWGGCRLS